LLQDYFIVSESYPELYSTVKKIFSDSGIKSVVVVSADLKKSELKAIKNS